MARHYEYIHPNNFSNDSELTKKDIWRGLKENTTVHGIPNLTRARGAVKKVFWVITICVTAGAFFYNVSAIAKSFADFPVSVSITLLHESELVFPAVTVCNMSPVRKSAVESSAAFNEEVNEMRKRRKRRRKRDAGEGCQNGWHYFNQSCYLVSTATASQSNARSACQSVDADLASILYQNEQDFLESVSTSVDQRQYWIGLYLFSGSTWGWTDGESLGYLYWAEYEPNGNGNCAKLTETGIWRDMGCNSKYKYICKIQGQGNSSVTPTVELETTQTTQQHTTELDTTLLDTTQQNSTQRDTTLAESTTVADSTSSGDKETATTMADTTQPSTKETTFTSQSDTTLAAPMDTTKTLTTLNVTLPATVELTPIETTEPPTSTEPPTTPEPPTSSEPLQSSCCCTCCFESSHYTGRQTCSTCADHTMDAAASCATKKYTESNATPSPTAAYDISDEPDPQPVEGSKFPERVETRESYKEEEKFTEVLANVNASEKYNMGFKAEDLILDCQYAGYDCYLSDFTTFYNSVHGNCYVFNSGWNQSLPLKKSYRAGRRHGLHMILNIDQDEYVKEVGDTAGLRLVVHPQKRMPFPEDEGITVPAGHATSIGIKQAYPLDTKDSVGQVKICFVVTQVMISRESHPYGSCQDPEQADYTSNVFEELYPVEYSTASCTKTCYQQFVIQRCGCADSQIPRTGIAFGNITVHACDSSDIEQDDCKYGVTKEYNGNVLKCNCPSSCRDVDFQLDLSSGVWPSNIQKADVLKKLAPKIGYMLDDPSNPEKYKENLIKLEVYYEEFNFEHVKETPSYPPQNFLSDIGGVLGLWLGMSILTIFEYVEFLIDMVVFSCVAKFGKNKIRSLGNSLPPKLSEAPRAKSAVGSSECLVKSPSVIATENMPRPRSGRSFSIAGDKESGSHMDDISEHSVEVGSSPLQSRLNSRPTSPRSATGSPTCMDGRGLSQPFHDKNTAKSDRHSAPLSARQVALCGRDSPVEMRGLGPPPPYSSRRDSEASDS